MMTARRHSRGGRALGAGLLLVSSLGALVAVGQPGASSANDAGAALLPPVCDASAVPSPSPSLSPSATESSPSPSSTSAPESESEPTPASPSESETPDPSVEPSPAESAPAESAAAEVPPASPSEEAASLTSVLPWISMGTEMVATETVTPEGTEAPIIGDSPSPSASVETSDAASPSPSSSTIDTESPTASPSPHPSTSVTPSESASPSPTVSRSARPAASRTPSAASRRTIACPATPVGVAAAPGVNQVDLTWTDGSAPGGESTPVTTQSSSDGDSEERETESGATASAAPTGEDALWEELPPQTLTAPGQPRIGTVEGGADEQLDATAVPVPEARTESEDEAPRPSTTSAPRDEEESPSPGPSASRSASPDPERPSTPARAEEFVVLVSGDGMNRVVSSRTAAVSVLGLKNGVRYSFQVFAVTGNGRSEGSEIVWATPTTQDP